MAVPGPLSNADAPPEQSKGWVPFEQSCNADAYEIFMTEHQTNRHDQEARQAACARQIATLACDAIGTVKN